MHTGSRYILTLGAGIGCLSICYFLALAAGAPFWLTLLFVAVQLFFVGRWMNTRQLVTVNDGNSKFALYVLIAGAFILTNKAYYIASKYGVWDAWAIWNFHAAYLADGKNWKHLLLNSQFAHPDYPLALPATLAFFNRLFQQTHNLLIAHGFHFLITLCVPILIYLETFRKSIFIAGLALLLFATNEFYIDQGVSQLADTLLAFFFLCAMVCMQHHTDDKRMLVLTAFFLGCCMWTKNEGVILAIIFVLFHVKELVGQYRLRYTLAGFAIPFAAWLFFKLAYAPPNDMVEGQNPESYRLLLNWERYKLIFTFLKNNISQYFRDVKFGVAIYLLLCTIRRRWPDKRLVMIFTCLLAYMLVYVVSPHDLEWHLFTSQSRLLHQLMPATMYVLALRFAGKAGSGFQAKFVSVRQRLR